MIKAVIFDLDGVLVDSTKKNYEAFEKILEESYSIKNPFKNQERILGLSLKELIEKFNEDYKIKINYEIFQEKLNKEQEKFHNTLQSNQNLLNFICELKKQGIKIAVGTNSPYWRTKIILEKINLLNLFEMIVTLEDVKNPKPAPDIYLKISKEFKIKSKDVIVFEDSLKGSMAAKAAGMKLIIRLTEFYKREDFKEFTNFFFEDFSELNVEKVLTNS